jgi:hypothetical protein
MQGKKNFTPQLFVSVNLLDMVPVDNFLQRIVNKTRFIFYFTYPLKSIMPRRCQEYEVKR